MGLSDLYHGAEEKYYDLLDRLQDIVPVYSIVDPIDSVMPSFALILVLITAGIGFAAFGMLAGPTGIAQVFVNLTAEDSRGNRFSNLSIDVWVDNSSRQVVTDAQGFASFAVP